MNSAHKTELPDDPRLHRLAEQFWDSFRVHSETPEISFRTYRAMQRLTLGKSVAQKTRIYLDTRYWIHVRDARLGRQKKPEHTRIYELLRKLVSGKNVICPTSFPAVDELLKHSDQKMRLASAEVLDELSGQVCLINHIELTRTEIMHLFRQFTPSYPFPAPMIECIWTKAGFWCGEMNITNETASPDFERAFQKAFEDQRTQTRFTDVVEEFFLFASPSSHREENFLQKLNDSFATFSKAAKSPRQLYKAQLLALLDEHNNLIADVSRQICQDMFNKTVEQCVHFLRPLLEQVLRQALSLKTIAFDLPGIHIWSTLLSAIAWDKKRLFAANDIHDIMHAHAALPYHNLVFVERAFSHLLISPPNKLAEVYGTRVFWKEADVIRELELLEQTIA